MRDCNQKVANNLCATWRFGRNRRRLARDLRVLSVLLGYGSWDFDRTVPILAPETTCDGVRKEVN